METVNDASKAIAQALELLRKETNIHLYVEHVNKAIFILEEALEKLTTKI
jgi:hypothetical protein